MKTDDTTLPTGWIYAYGVAIALFHIWFNTWGTLSTLHFNCLHLALMGSFGFLVLPGRGFKYYDRIAAAVIFVGACYLLFAEEPMHQRGEALIALDSIMAAATIIATLLLCRRTSGWVMPVLAVFGILYILYIGRYLDGIFHFRGLGLERVLYRFYFTGEGLFGFVATLSATFVFMFILFSAFLLQSGAGEFIIRIARRTTATLPGGGGYVAVISSALTGTINGSAVANTVATGSITIPLMKRYGFSPAFAAGLETAASTGGQLLPPVMGAGAFIIAQYTGLSYTAVIAAALLPALLYFFSLMVAVFLEARRLGLKSDNTKPREPWLPILRGGLPFIVPVTLLIFLLVRGYSPAYAAGGGILAVAIASWLSPGGGMRLKAVADALVLGVRLAAPTAILLLASGLVIGALNMTGSGVAFSQLLVGLSGGWLFPALVLVALASLILGMGLPVTAAYVVVAVVAAPALEGLGITLLAAHLIIFWFSQDSNVTPPVCLAAFAAAGIAGSRPFATGFTAWRLAKGLYIIPLLFAYTALIDGDWTERIRISIFAAAGLLLLFAGMSGYLRSRLSTVRRIACLAAAAACLWPSIPLNATGVLVLATLWLLPSAYKHQGQKQPVG